MKKERKEVKEYDNTVTRFNVIFFYNLLAPTIN